MRDYFQWKFEKKNLAINNCFVNETKSGQPNKRLIHWHFRELNGYFFYCGRLSSAQLDRWQAPKQWPIIDQRLVEQTAYRRDIKDNGYKSVFTNSWLVHQRDRLWIKGLGKSPQKNELIHWRQCLLSGATEPCSLELRETLVCIHVILHNVTATCGMLTWLPAKLAKNVMRVQTSADLQLKIKLRV